MEKVHRELIQVNYLKLSKCIRHGILEVVKYLRQSKLISDTMEEDIVCQRTPSEKAYRLLDVIQTRGPKAFGILYKAVLEAELWEAADLLEPKKAPHGALIETVHSSSSATSLELVEEDEPLPVIWPTEDHLLKVEELKLKVKEVEKHQTLMIRRFRNPNKACEYALNQKCKGRVLIIDNEVFTNELSERTGSSQDTKGLRCVFQALDFDVCVKSNKTKMEMDKILDEECRRKFNDTGCFILIILSHGVRGKVFGTDGIAPKEGTPVTQVDNYIEIESIKQRIAAVDTLKGKPKMFIIQACQSDEARTSDHEPMLQESSPANNDDTNQQGNSSSNSLDPLVFPGVKTKTPQGSAPGPVSGHDSEDVELNSDTGDNVDSNQTFVKRPADGSDVQDGNESNKEKGSLAKDAGDADSATSALEGSDIFTALATIEGHPSYRNTAFGSWFIQAFIYVLANYAHKHELSSLMRKVTQLVMKARSRKDESQVCERRSTMDKEFYFFPGLTLDMS